MAEPGIFAYVDGSWVPDRATYPAGINRIFVYKDGAWRGVVTVWSYSRSTKWSQIVDNTWYAAPYLVLHHGEATNTTAPMHWDDAPRAVSFRCYKQERGKPSTRVMVVPKPPSGRYYEWTGLSEQTQYDFWVTGINSFGAESPPSNHLNLTTGRNAGPLRHHDPFDWIGNPGRQDTFDMEKKWDRYSTPYVVQGHKGAAGGDNSYGCVHYGALGQQLADDFPDTPDLIHHVVVNKATLVQIRRANDSGSARPVLWLHSGYINFNAVKVPPDDHPPQQNILAPSFPPGDTGNNIDLDHPSWAQSWIDNTTQDNGLVIHRIDSSGNDSIGYDGYCVLAPQDDAGLGQLNWRLRLNISWNYHWPPATAPVWNWS